VGGREAVVGQPSGLGQISQHNGKSRSIIFNNITIWLINLPTRGLMFLRYVRILVNSEFKASEPSFKNGLIIYQIIGQKMVLLLIFKRLAKYY
jgi:hypothetical protein